MNQLFNSVYVANEANAKPEMLMMSLLVALLTGLWLAWVYKYKTLYTKDFVITLVGSFANYHCHDYLFSQRQFGHQCGCSRDL